MSLPNMTCSPSPSSSSSSSSSSPATTTSFGRTLPIFPFINVSDRKRTVNLYFCNKSARALGFYLCSRQSSSAPVPSSTEFSCSANHNNRNRRGLPLGVPCFAETETSPAGTTTTADRLRLLVLEFESLAEPIDRVKRLLDYAARLPPFDESARLPDNRVTGCTTQVWLEVRMEEGRRMRFRADSDSEITKGFISCLIWLLDGAEPEEVAAVKAEDLEAMNVGLYGRAQSRVNTWHNVLISMQKRTLELALANREGNPPLRSLVASKEGIVAKKLQKSRWKELDGQVTWS